MERFLVPKQARRKLTHFCHLNQVLFYEFPAYSDTPLADSDQETNKVFKGVWVCAWLQKLEL